MNFVNEPTAVEVHFDIDGHIRPRRFSWNRNWLDVSDVGRQWMDSDGRHVLVMTGGRHTFELLLDAQDLAWRIVRAPDDITLA